MIKQLKSDKASEPCESDAELFNLIDLNNNNVLVKYTTLAIYPKNGLRPPLFIFRKNPTPKAAWTTE